MQTALQTTLSILLLLLAAACSEGQNARPHTAEPGTAAPFIIAVNNPLRYFTARLLEGRVDVRLLAPAGQDPAQWQPTVADIAQLQQAELIILNGAGYSSWREKISISARKLIDSSAGLENQLIKLEKQTTHSHGPEGEHAHGEYAFTLWMDLSLAQAQSETIASALQRVFPQYSAAIAANLETLHADLAELDRQYQQWGASVVDQRIIFSHPVYQYFERRYHLKGRSLHWEPDQMPAQGQWEKLRALTGSDDNTLLIWEGTPSNAIADRLQQLGIAYAVVDPGAGPRNPDWLALQQRNLASLTSGLTDSADDSSASVQAP